MTKGGADHPGLRPHTPIQEGTMLTFFSGCASLFTHIFNTACGLDFFRFLAACLVFQVGLGLFLMLYHGTRKP